VVQYQDQLDQTFAALSDPTRRGILERVGQGRATISELAAPFGISLTGMKKHVRVLEDAGLVQTEKVGRARWCAPGPQDLDEVQRWIGAYRLMLEERFDRLGELLDATKGQDS
jgi:DNA-binding transcriptional ArsR family regulator